MNLGRLELGTWTGLGQEMIGPGPEERARQRERAEQRGEQIRRRKLVEEYRRFREELAKKKMAAEIVLTTETAMREVEKQKRREAFRKALIPIAVIGAFLLWR